MTSTSKHSYDLIIVGSGFGGSMLSIIACKLGWSVALVEKGSHPRFAVGESTTPLANLYLEFIADRYSLEEIKSLHKWGSWQIEHKDLPVGLKRGFSFFHHQSGRPFTSDSCHRNQLLVAASPHARIADTHWFRSSFDEYLVRCAVKYGADYYENTELTDIAFNDDNAMVRGRCDDRELNLDARLVVDASGPRGFLFRQMNLGEENIRSMPPTQGLYNHFYKVRRMDEISGLFNAATPYPPDDAAVHHIVDEGWMWMLRFNNGIVSAGLSLKDDYACKIGLSEGDKGWNLFLEKYPTLRELFAESEPLHPFMHTPRLSFRSRSISGDRWALLPSAAGFADPLLSMGFPLNLRGILRLAKLMEKNDPWNDAPSELKNYSAQTRAELDLSALMIGGLYARLNDFEIFTALSLIYFAAASFSETAIRLGTGSVYDSFLLHDRPGFGPLLHRCFETALRKTGESERRHLAELIYNTIEPVDVAGLSDRSRHNWFPVRMDDIANNAAKLSVEPSIALNRLKKAGF